MRTLRSMETWMASWVLRTLADVSTLITLSVRVDGAEVLADGRSVCGIADSVHAPGVYWKGDMKSTSVAQHPPCSTDSM